MPRYAKRRFQVGDFWLDTRVGSPAFYRCWLDGRQVRRVSLGTIDEAEAKRLLIEWVAANYQAPADDLPPSKVKLRDVLQDYWNGHGQHVRSHETTAIMLRYWNEYWGEATVADVRDAKRQDGFRAHLSKRLGHNSINRCLEVGRAAIRRAWKRGVISSAPFVQMLPSIENKPMGRPLSHDELVALLRGCTQPHLRLYIVLGLATGGRPEAITDLRWEQVDGDLIRLNPEGRAQNKKYRPVVRVGEATKAVLNAAYEGRGSEHLIAFRGRQVRRLDTIWKKATDGMAPGVTAYSLRHTVARYLRTEGVDAWQVSSLLGHRRVGFEMSERYTAHSPDYQKDAAAALDRLVSFLLGACQLLTSDPLIWGTKHENRKPRSAHADPAFPLEYNQI